VGKWGDCWRTFRRCLKDPEFRGKVRALETAGGEEELQRAGAVRLRSRLQEEGRLLDFLMEDIDSYDDRQVGSAVRSIHKKCRAVIEEIFELGPVIAGSEGKPVTVEEGFDPLAVRLEGNVGSKPPFRGVLRHPGWRAERVSFPPASPDRDRNLIAPAEVEVQ